MNVDVSVIIPTHGRPDKLRRCLDALARQKLATDVTVETIVAIDGGDETDAYQSLEPGSPARFLSLPRRGIAAARNAAIEAAEGDLLLMTNDDCYPDPDWVTEHLRAQRLRRTPGMVLGRTRWRAWRDPTVFDALIRDTSMVFFFDRMHAGRVYAFRHFWTCNASVPTWMAREVGGFDVRLRPYGYEDLEFAFRIERAGFPGVLYHFAAENEHDHRLTWRDYRNREACLGRMAACLAEMNLDCFEQMYGDRDPRRMREAFSRWLALDEGDHRSADEEMTRWAERPLAKVSDWPALRDLLYRLHLPVKRRCFRQAFVDHFDLRDDAHWPERLALGHGFP